MSDASDLMAGIVAGAVLRTRDRRQARILRVEPARGLVHGEVEMHGPCAWRADGLYLAAPFGAPGPLDLTVPEVSPAAADGRERSSVAEALAAGNRHFCCDWHRAGPDARDGLRGSASLLMLRRPDGVTPAGRCLRQGRWHAIVRGSADGSDLVRSRPPARSSAPP
jgi:hypothetical protein